METFNVGSPAASHGRVDKSAAETADRSWKSLYKVAAVAAVITVLVIPIQIVVFIAWPPPSTVIDYFTVFHDNWLVGLLNLDLLLLVDNVLLIPIFLALYVALRRVSQSFMAIGTALGFAGLAAYYASNTAFNMLSLSNQYAAATTDAQRSVFLAAGQAMLTTYTGTAFQLSYVLGSIAAIVISAVMLRSHVFGKVTAWMGIVANVVGLGIFIPKVGIILAIISVVPFLAIWYVLVARRLFQLGWGTSQEGAALRKL